MNSTGYEGIGWIREGRRWGIESLVPKGVRWQGSARESGQAEALSGGFLGQASAAGRELTSR